MVTMATMVMLTGISVSAQARTKHVVTIPSCVWRPTYGPSASGTCAAAGGWGIHLEYSDGTHSANFNPSQYTAWWAQDFTLWFDMHSLTPVPQAAPVGVDY